MSEYATPAFPQPNSVSHTLTKCAGMTLRDYFAAAAIQGMLANPASMNKTKEAVFFHSSNAQVAYELADAMLKAREQ